ncbi:PREDICTED: actin-like protein 10 [Cariama cristata]|uniref:actin-like protein 10 n=1 Tax=Cariama cristata TaxID=54380 RepID=UPI000520F0D6|nr:PREDICTED: actin-like protein 10 [Cariama cristata]
MANTRFLSLCAYGRVTGPKALNKKTVIQLKKRCCYVSTDYEGDLHDQGYHPPAPDGHWITLDKERFCCLEPLFQLKLLHQSSPRLHHLALQSLQKVPNHASRVTHVWMTKTEYQEHDAEYVRKIFQ